MFEEEADIRAVKPLGIAHVITLNRLRILQRLAEIGAYDILVADFGTEGSLADESLHPGIEIDPEHIGSVMVVRDGFRIAPHQLKPVPAVVPIDRRAELDHAVRPRRDRHEGLERVLELVVEFRAVECIGTEVPAADACRPVQDYLRMRPAALIEGLDGIVVGIEPACLIPAEAV